jgi:hypothetical protein
MTLPGWLGGVEGEWASWWVSALLRQSSRSSVASVCWSLGRRRRLQRCDGGGS